MKSTRALVLFVKIIAKVILTLIELNVFNSYHVVYILKKFVKTVNFPKVSTYQIQDLLLKAFAATTM